MSGFPQQHDDRHWHLRSRTLCVVQGVLALLLSTQSTVAWGQLTWTGAVNSTWNTTTSNWSGAGSNTWSNPGTAVFDTTAAADRRSITLTGTAEVNAVTVSANGYEFNGGTFRLNGTAPLTFNNSGTINSNIVSAPSASFVKRGTGTLALTGTVSMSDPAVGFISIEAGTVVQTAGAITLARTSGYAGSGALFIGNSASGAAFTATGGTLRTTGAGGNASLDVGTAGNAVLTINGGSLGFGGDLNRIARTTASGTISLQSGELALNNLSKGANGTATFNFSGGTLRPFNANTTFGSTTSGSNFTITLSSTGATISGLDQATNTARTVDIYTPLAGSGGITFAGGTSTLRTANTHSGTTAITAGRLVLTDANALQNSTYSGNGGTLAFGVASGTTFNFGGLAGSSPLTLTSTDNSSVSLVVGANNASTTFSGNMSGTNASGVTFNKVGTGTMTISGDWSLGADGTTSDGFFRITTGEIRQTAGTVALRRNQASGGLIVGEFGSTGAYTIESGTLLAFNSDSPGGSSVRIGGGGTGILSINGAAASVRLSGTNINLGGNDVGGASGTGTINLTAGELAVNSLTTGTAAGAAGSFNFSGGTLRPYSQDTSIGRSDSGFTMALTGSAATLSGLDVSGAARTLTILTTLVNGTSGAGGVIVSGGTVSLAAANTYTGATTLAGTNTTLVLGAAGSFASSATITVGNAVSSGAVLDLTAKSGSFAFGSGQTLMGGGTVKLASNTVLNVQGTFSPGNSPGLFSYDGGTTLLSGTTLMEIWGTSRATLPSHGSGFYDAVNIINGGMLNFNDSVLTLDFNQSFGNGATFSLFTASGSSSLLGTFGSINVTGSAYTGLTWTSGTTGVWTSSATTGGQTLSFDSTNGMLIIVPEPAAIPLAGIGIAAAAYAFRRRK